MITRSINVANPRPSIPPKKPTKKSNHNNKSKNNRIEVHKPPIFYCDCFDCYTNYWNCWNSSPNRDLIQEAIERFEEHLSHNEKSRKITKSGSKRRNHANRRNDQKTDDKPPSPLPVENVLYPITSPKAVVTGSVAVGVEMMVEKAVFVHSLGSNHKGSARKVLPDLLGLLNSRLQSLESECLSY